VQDLAWTLNDWATLKILREHPKGASKKQVTDKFREAHNDIVKQQKELGEKMLKEFRESNPSKPLPAAFRGVLLFDRVPKPGKSPRITVSEHLEYLVKFHYASKIGRLYFVSEPVVSITLSEEANRLFSHDPYQDVGYLAAPDVSLFRSYVTRSNSTNTSDENKPQDYRFTVPYKFDEFFNSQYRQFLQSLFHLDQMVEEAIAKGHMSEEVYDPARASIRRLNVDLLTKGLREYFADAKLLAWVCVLDPSKLLEYLQTEGGKEAAAWVISQRWSTIRDNGIERRLRMQRNDRIRDLRITRTHDEPKGGPTA
jgi:hypothetical protein